MSDARKTANLVLYYMTYKKIRGHLKAYAYTYAEGR